MYIRGWDMYKYMHGWEMYIHGWDMYIHGWDMYIHIVGHS